MYKFSHQVSIALLFLCLSNWARAQEDVCVNTTGTFGFLSPISQVSDVVDAVDKYLLSDGYLKDGDKYYFPDRDGFLSLESNGNTNLNIILPEGETGDLDVIMEALTNSLIQEFDNNTLSRRRVRIITSKGVHCVPAI